MMRLQVWPLFGLQDPQLWYSLEGTSNNTLLWLSERLRRSCQGGPPIGDRFDA